ncbi:hypothetical protein C4J87_2047 [Pseudomonas sp. R1-43-08]|uniref:hypothetical protein n=1 Tax=Pseudomonas sp. R1-43-08 TaxID=1173270 RepID=UPI000F565106|nr:hypothetical protein [Pseudomonas sp. R1-43-08]AZF42206.1 hypothetical protein C4J87_2047 [Pseudomonas sp. R1-43-08]
MKEPTSSNLPIPLCESPPHEPASPSAVNLDPPYVNGALRPNLDADVGLGIRQIDPWLIVNFEKWSNFNVGDTYKFFAGSTNYALGAGEVYLEDLYKDRVQLVIPASLVPEGTIYPCFGEVIRVGSATPSTSPPQTWYTKTSRPGGRSIYPWFHSNLVIHLPEDLEYTPLDAERAKAGVDLTCDFYPFCTVGDTIEVWWNGIAVFQKIDQQHVDGTKPIIVHVPEQTIISGGSGAVSILFRVFDRVLNYSGEDPQWSKVVKLETDLERGLLDRPHFVVGGESVDELNLDTHGDEVFTAEMVVPRTLPATPNDTARPTPVGALIHVTLTQFYPDGSSSVVTLPGFPARIGLSSSIVLDNKYLEDVIDGQLRIEYTLTTASGAFLRASRRLSIRVFGTKKMMPPMRIEQDEGGLIDPEHPFIRAIFPVYSPYAPSNSVTFRMETPRPGGGLIEYEETVNAGAPPPPDRFRIVLQEDFAPFIGVGPVKVYYLVNDHQMRTLGPGVQTVRKSEVLEVIFGSVVAELPAPQLQYVDVFDNLDPASVIGGQLKLTLPETRTFPGDKFFWTWLGANASGTTGGEVELYSDTAGKPVVVLVDEAFVIANDNKEIRLSYALAPKDGSRRRYSERRTITVGQALTLKRPEVVQASRYPDQLAAVAATKGATVVVEYPQMLPSHQVRCCWTGIADIGTYCETQYGSSSKVLHFDIDPEVVGANIQAQGHVIHVQYFVMRGEHESPSPVLALELLPPPLPEPYIEGHSYDGVLNIGTLNGTERAIEERWHFSHRFQRMWFEMSGTYADGYPFDHTFYTADLVTQDGELNGIRPPAPVAELRKLKDGSPLTMRFGVTFDRSAERANAVWFKERRYTIQALPAQFPVPTLIEATGSGTLVTLAPLNAQYGAHVQVSTSPMYTSDVIFVEVVGKTAAGSAVIGPKYGETDGTVIVDVPASVIAANIGNTPTQFTIRYTVTRGGQTRPSVPLTVNLESLPLSELRKTVIRIDQASASGVIDVDALPGNATARVTTFPFIAPHLPVWLYLYGFRADGTPHNLTLMNGSNKAEVDSAWISQGYHLETVLINYLRDLGNRSQLTLQFKAALNGVRDELQAIEFPPTRYTLQSVMIKECTTFNDNYMNYWLSEWPDAGIRRESNGNYFWQSTPTTGRGVSLYKVLTPAAEGYYRVSFRYRISKFAAIGGPTFVEIHLGTLKWTQNVPTLNTWLSVNVPLGYLPGKPFEASVSVRNPTTGGVYDIDDICITQTPYPTVM